MKQKLTLFTIISLIILTFINYPLVLSSTLSSVSIFLNKVFPYLFIMIIFQDLLLNLNILSLFKNTSLYIYLISLLSGTPTSTLIISRLYKDNNLPIDATLSSLIYSNFPNPLFLYTILSSIFKTNFITFKLIFIIYFTSFIMYLLYSKKCPKVSINTSSFNISNSIKLSLNTCLMVLGVITFYLVISSILKLNPYLSGFLEMTQGLNYLINSNFIYKEYLALIFITFQGFSIHTQVKCILDDYNLPYYPYLKGRLLHTSLSLGLLILINLVL